MSKVSVTPLDLPNPTRALDRLHAREPARGTVWENLCRLMPALQELQHYSAQVFRADLVAGLTVASVAVPQAMAYAVIAGLPPQHGLYTAIVMTAVGSLLASSRQLINGPTCAISIALLTALTPIDDTDRLSAAILLAFLAGMLQIGITCLRLGDLTRYISPAVIVGFRAGAGVLLILDQFRYLFGITVPGPSSDHFLKRILLTLAQGQIDCPWTVLVGLGTIGVVLGLRCLKPYSRICLPEYLVAILGGAVVVWLGGLADLGVKVIGTIPAELPAFACPWFEWERVRELTGSALAIALLGLLEAVAMAKALALQTGQTLNIHQQCLSEGVANCAGSFFQCFPGSGSLSRSAINQQAGARSQWSGVFCAAAVAVTVLLFAPLASRIPYAALAGILMISTWRMIEPRDVFAHLRARPQERGVVFVTALAILALSVELAILLGVCLALLRQVSGRALASDLRRYPPPVRRLEWPGA